MGATLPLPFLFFFPFIFSPSERPQEEKEEIGNPPFSPLLLFPFLLIFCPPETYSRCVVVVGRGGRELPSFFPFPLSSFSRVRSDVVEVVGRRGRREGEIFLSLLFLFRGRRSRKEKRSSFFFFSFFFGTPPSPETEKRGEGKKVSPLPLFLRLFRIVES